MNDFAETLKSAGKRVRVINLNEMEKSHRYNPFKYIRSADDITRLITNFIANTTPAGATPSDPFWDKAESLFEQGIFGYVWLECNDVPYYRYVQINKKGQFAADAAELSSVAVIRIQLSLSLMISGKEECGMKEPKSICF